jgi:hypothetical protein
MEWGKLRVERQWGELNGAGGKTKNKKAKSRTQVQDRHLGYPAVGHIGLTKQVGLVPVGYLKVIRPSQSL